jgi:hypothetical protein
MSCRLHWSKPSGNGYCYVKHNGATIGAHKLSYILHFGYIPKGQLVMHSCDNPRCINPEHLSLGSAADNSKDKVLKNRQAKRYIVGAKLSDVQVTWVRELHKKGYTNRQLGTFFGLHNTTINRIVRQERYHDF